MVQPGGPGTPQGWNGTGSPAPGPFPTPQPPTQAITPMQSFGHPYGYPPAYPQQHETSGFAIASLVLGLGCGLLGLGGGAFGLIGGALLSIVFGMVALSRTGQGKRPGRGLAIGGLVAAGAWIGAVVLTVASSGSHPDARSSAVPGCATPQAGYVNICTMKVGECLDYPGSTPVLAKLTACGEAHDTQVVGAFEEPAGPYPGEGRFTTDATTQCRSITSKNVDSSLVAPTDKIGMFYADRETWGLGVHTVFCFIQRGAPSTGSVLRPDADLSVPTGG
ncbi:septum formation family protein [Amycolatopsis cynarae]|uniref:Septum formation family protein n=1 Tax=Amycolatopsis cynarae TaxID=2995223 RepID=A0ABY7AV56_9PSEU|nr:DUF4190 domain-containing protein [Amycolatopsis sp. HUAS 11-8]WAL63816.1 septum formation family protein [Amycolatopsis sp. HUAS 11-8]